MPNLILPPEEELTEARIQQECLLWLNQHHRPAERWFFAVPNGEKRDRVTAGRLKAQGVKSGVADTFLPLARGAYHGLFIEFKTPSGVLSDKQKEFLADIRAAGFGGVVIDRIADFQHLLTDYLALAPGEQLAAQHYHRWPLGFR